MSYQTSSKRSSPSWLLIGARKLVFFWHQSEARTGATVWNWSGKTLSPGALLAVLYFSFVPYFSTCLNFPSPPLSAPGSPRMGKIGSTEAHRYDLQLMSMAQPNYKTSLSLNLTIRLHYHHVITICLAFYFKTVSLIELMGLLDTRRSWGGGYSL